MSIKASKDDLAALLRGADDAKDGLSSVATTLRPAVTVKTPVPAPQPQPVSPDTGSKPYRSQGLTIYESDEEIVDEMIAYLRRTKIKIGRKRGFSLFARAGLRALDRLRQSDPASFEAMLRLAVADQS